MEQKSKECEKEYEEFFYQSLDNFSFMNMLNSRTCLDCNENIYNYTKANESEINKFIEDANNIISQIKNELEKIKKLASLFNIEKYENKIDKKSYKNNKERIL